jgi:hypothetical protein
MSPTGEIKTEYLHNALTNYFFIHAAVFGSLIMLRELIYVLLTIPTIFYIQKMITVNSFI